MANWKAYKNVYCAAYIRRLAVSWSRGLKKAARPAAQAEKRFDSNPWLYRLIIEVHLYQCVNIVWI